MRESFDGVRAVLTHHLTWLCGRRPSCDPFSPPSAILVRLASGRHAELHRVGRVYGLTVAVIVRDRCESENAPEDARPRARFIDNQGGVECVHVCFLIVRLAPAHILDRHPFLYLGPPARLVRLLSCRQRGKK